MWRPCSEVCRRRGRCGGGEFLGGGFQASRCGLECYVGFSCNGRGVGAWRAEAGRAGRQSGALTVAHTPHLISSYRAPCCAFTFKLWSTPPHPSTSIPRVPPPSSTSLHRLVCPLRLLQSDIIITSKLSLRIEPPLRNKATIVATLIK